ncbi:twin-arginine translocase TatA/TatE family subunit [Cohnella sp. WQ 127256]|uniref:twin-arginine translocase TatA/TatE family subunit n=1 Tax=Cohnella sp. WQ 127256 TaxID=2938790 RepID=UPI002118A322|nr:twin-arginine translocase TatA/TatE family subunit [Cohnella sp. WQ 127256]
MPLNIGGTGLLIIILIAILFFGPSKLPQLGKAIGSTLREFKAGTRELIQSEEHAPKVTKESNE